MINPALAYNSACGTSTKQSVQYQLYIDGSCLRNPGGSGGWCAILLINGIKIDESSGSDPSTTNNAMELMSAIKGLKMVPTGMSAEVFSDSQYVVKGCNEWCDKWDRNGWVTSKNKEPVKNAHLWKRLVKLRLERHCHFTWVRGHSGNVWNEECDKIAAARANNEHRRCRESVSGAKNSHTRIRRNGRPQQEGFGSQG